MCEPAGQAVGFCGSFCRTARTAIPSARLEKATPSREFFPNGREIHPKAEAPARFPPLLASGNCRASASRDSVRVMGALCRSEEEEPGGAVMSRETPGLCQAAVSSTSLGKGNFLPFPTLTRYPVWQSNNTCCKIMPEKWLGVPSWTSASPLLPAPLQSAGEGLSQSYSTNRWHLWVCFQGTDSSARTEVLQPLYGSTTMGQGRAVRPRSNLFVQGERGDYVTGAKQVPWKFKLRPEIDENKLYYGRSDGKDKGADGLKKKAHCTREMKGKLLFLFPVHVSWWWIRNTDPCRRAPASRLNENLGGSAPRGPIGCFAHQQPPAAACKLCFSLQAGRSCQEVPGDSSCSWKGTFSWGTDGGVEERGRGSLLTVC